MSVTLDTSAYGRLPDGRDVHQFILQNARGLRVTLLDYGAMLAAVETPDRAGKVADITHGFASLAGWLRNPAYLGANVGRFANRIAGGRFTLDGRTYALATNNTPAGRPCHLHGGNVGLDQRLWSGRGVERPGARGVAFSYLSPDGEEGYPGNLSLTATTWLGDDDTLAIEFYATTDRATIVNVTNHAYWNLSGDPRTPVADHLVQLHADAFLPVDAGLIPTGQLASVAGTPFDFTAPHTLGARIDADHEQLRFGAGYDHCWVLRGAAGALRPAARVVEPRSGRTLELLSDQPGLQLYTGNFLDGGLVGKGGVAYARRTAFCLEPQRFPDAPNQPHFPSATLRPGETYTHALVYRFGVA